MLNILEVEGVSRSFGSLRALNDVSWSVPKRGIHGLVGPNGAGKTTLYGIVCGFLAADEGRVRVGNATISTSSPPVAGAVGVLPQDGMLPEHLPVGATLIHYGELGGLDKKTAEGEARRVLGLVGLEDAFSKKPKTLSHGMFKRVAIAQAFIGRPPLVLLDEPTAGLDPHAAREIRSLLRGLRGEGSIVVSSHNLAEVEDLCDSVAILDAGKVVRHDSMSDVVGEAASIDVRLVGAPTEALESALGALHFVTGVSFNQDTDRLRIEFDASRTEALDASHGVVGVLCETRSAFQELQVGSSLEDRFLEETS